MDPLTRGGSSNFVVVNYGEYYLRALTLAKRIGKLALTKKARDVIMMDLRKLTSVADFFVVCSADSDVQVKAIAEAVESGMEKAGVIAWHREKGSANWILLDYVDVVLHVFHKHAREYYSLERLWGDAAITRMDDEGEVVRPKTGRRKAATISRRSTREKAM
jgi:ribosome-associated protein